MKLSISAILACLLLAISPAHSRPAFTQEQLAKAREAASTAKQPIDFDKLMDEADRLGVECEGDLTDWIWIRICSLKVETAQSRERQHQMRRETIEAINKAADIADKKLKKLE